VSGLEPGAVAPDFELRDQHGQRRALSALRGRPVALVFFPAAFSSVCGSELVALRDWWADPADRRPDVELWAISCDPMFSLRGYADAEGIDFPLLSDFWPHGAVAQAYGVLDQTSGTALRSSYVVDGEGRIAWAVHNAPSDPRPVADLEQALAALGG
jgi:peroxiredoxin